MYHPKAGVLTAIVIAVMTQLNWIQIFHPQSVKVAPMASSWCPNDYQRLRPRRPKRLRVSLAAAANRLQSSDKQNNNWRTSSSSPRKTRMFCKKYWPLIHTCCIQITTLWSLQSGKKLIHTYILVTAFKDVSRKDANS